jgi:putative thioredoxin
MEIIGQSFLEKRTLKKITLESFHTDVIEASAEELILVDFWAPWCNPCQQLKPLLENAVAQEPSFVLAQINVDEEPEIAQQLRIQSLPTVIAFFKGHPVDGFTGLLSPQEIKAFLAKLKSLLLSSDDLLLQQGEEKLAKNDIPAALQLFTQVLTSEPQNLKALSGMVRGYLYKGDLEKARGYWQLISLQDKEREEFKSLKKALELAEESEKIEEVAEIGEFLDKNPLAHDKRLTLAKALFGKGHQEEAIEELFKIISYDLQWNDQQARRELLNFIDALGPSSPLAVTSRKKLSKVIFK